MHNDHVCLESLFQKGCRTSAEVILTKNLLIRIIKLWTVCPDALVYSFKLLVAKRLPHPYQMGVSTFILRGIRSDLFIFISFFDENHASKQNSARWDTASCGVTSGVILFVYVRSHKKDATGLIWVNQLLTNSETSYQIIGRSPLTNRPPSNREHLVYVQLFPSPHMMTS